jgi:GNAT superfamily N-acetyltransferase
MGRRCEVQADTSFVLGLVAADARERLSDVPGALREDLVALQVRAQRAHLAEAWPDAQDWILVDAAGVDVGRLLVGRTPEAVHVLDVRVAAAHRGRGIGSAGLAALLAEADAEGLPVELHVEPGNAARRLYERLGFVADPVPAGLPVVDLLMRRPPGGVSR